MSIGVFFWILLLLAVVLGAFGYRAHPTPYWAGGSLILFLLLLAIGWKLFGSPIHN